MQPKKVYRLNDDEVKKPFKLIGISASCKYFKLCHHLNNAFSVDFKALPDPKFKTTKEKHTVLEAKNELGETEYHFFVNKEGAKAMVPECAEFDFLLKAYGKKTAAALKKIIGIIREQPGVILVSELPATKIKSIGKLDIQE